MEISLTFSQLFLNKNFLLFKYFRRNGDEQNYFVSNVDYHRNETRSKKQMRLSSTKITIRSLMTAISR